MSADILERLVQAIRPQLQVSKRLAFHDEPGREPRQPSDLLGIDYEPDDDVSAADVLSACPEGVGTGRYSVLLERLTQALCDALDDATEAEVESADVAPPISWTVDCDVNHAAVA
jgi:hypothetical protein